MPWPRKTSTCRSFVTISSGLCRFFAIVILLHGQNHTSRWTRSMGVDQGSDDVAVLDLVPADVALQFRRQHAQYLAVDVVDGGGQQQQRADAPAIAAARRRPRRGAGRGSDAGHQRTTVKVACLS